MRCKTLAAAALAALCASGEQAKLFIFTYIETSSTPTIFTSELKLVTTDVLTDGHYTITGVSGWFSGPSLDASDQVVTGLGGYASPDNFLYPAGPFLDAAGFSVDTATPNLFNFYYDGNYAEISPVISAPVPEPATWARMLAGFAGLGYAGYRKSRKAAPIAA